MLIFQTFKQFAEGLSNTRVAMIIIVVSNVVNIGLNYVMIYGHAGFPAMGLNGAGWATFSSRVFMALSFAAYIYFAPRFREYRIGFSIGKYSMALVKKCFTLAYQAVYSSFSKWRLLTFTGNDGMAWKQPHKPRIK
jgi:MATE family multidrug resistance protein